MPMASQVPRRRRGTPHGSHTDAADAVGSELVQEPVAATAPLTVEAPDEAANDAALVAALETILDEVDVDAPGASADAPLLGRKATDADVTSTLNMAQARDVVDHVEALRSENETQLVSSVKEAGTGGESPGRGSGGPCRRQGRMAPGLEAAPCSAAFRVRGRAPHASGSRFRPRP